MQLSKKGLKIRLGQSGLLAIAALIFLAPLPALTAEGDPELIPRCSGAFKLCSYVEKGSGVERIPQRFEVAKPFSEGLAAIRIGGLYGYIDPTGKIVITPSFENAGPFAGNYAEIRLDNTSGIINRSGQIVVKPQFRRIVPFTGDTFIAQPFVNIANKMGEVRIDQQLEAVTESSALSSYNDSGLFHAKKGWLSAQNLQFRIFDKPERGLIWAENRSSNYNRTWGLMRSDGSWQVKPSYDEVLQLTGTRAEVLSLPDLSLPFPQRREVQRWGAVDRDGKLIVPMEFVFLRFRRGEYGIAMDAKPDYSSGTRSGGREAIVRTDGTLLASRYFDKVEIEDGKPPRGLIGKIWYRVEPDGRMIPEQPDAEKLLLECPGGMSIVERGETVEFRRPGEARPVGPFDKSFFQRSDCPGPFPVKRDGRWFMVSEDGSILGGKRGFENTYSFSGRNHTAVQVDGKWGIIDRSGAFTVKPDLTELRPVREGTFVVNERTEPYWIDASGKRVEKPSKERPSPEQALTCAGGLRFFERGGLWGFQDSSGKIVIEPRFRALSCFNQGVSWAAAPGAKAWCAIDPNGKRRDAMACREAYHPAGWSHHYPEKLSDDPYESSVLWNRALLEYRARKRDTPPKWIGDGYRGQGSIDAE